jgi:hypothetical protein
LDGDHKPQDPFTCNVTTAKYVSGQLAPEPVRTKSRPFLEAATIRGFPISQNRTNFGNSHRLPSGAFSQPLNTRRSLAPVCRNRAHRDHESREECLLSRPWLGFVGGAAAWLHTEHNRASRCGGSACL